MILRVEGARAGYGGTDVLHGLSLEVGPGEAVGVLGANGAGKTTLMRVVSGQLALRQGSLEVAGSTLRRARTSVMVRKGIVLVAEGHEVIGSLSVLENLRLGAFRFWPRPDPAVERSLEQAFDLFPILAERRHQLAALLSGGQQQERRTRHERSLGLAPIVVDEIYDRLDLLRREAGLAMVVVEQSSARVADFCDRIHVMRLGEFVASSEAGSAPLSEDDLRVAYFGE